VVDCDATLSLSVLDLSPTVEEKMALNCACLAQCYANMGHVSTIANSV
jgi:hypothetical protein